VFVTNRNASALLGVRSVLRVVLELLIAPAVASAVVVPTRRIGWSTVGRVELVGPGECPTGHDGVAAHGRQTDGRAGLPPGATCARRTARAGSAARDRRHEWRARCARYARHEWRARAGTARARAGRRRAATPSAAARRAALARPRLTGEGGAGTSSRKPRNQCRDQEVCSSSVNGETPEGPKFGVGAPQQALGNVRSRMSTKEDGRSLASCHRRRHYRGCAFLIGIAAAHGERPNAAQTPNRGLHAKRAIAHDSCGALRVVDAVSVSAAQIRGRL